MPTNSRTVIEYDTELKEQLGAALAQDRKTLKDWFVVQAREYLGKRHQSDFFDQISGKIDPHLLKQLEVILQSEKRTLEQWLVDVAKAYISQKRPKDGEPPDPPPPLST